MFFLRVLLAAKFRWPEQGGQEFRTTEQPNNDNNGYVNRGMGKFNNGGALGAIQKRISSTKANAINENDNNTTIFDSPCIDPRFREGSDPVLIAFVALGVALLGWLAAEQTGGRKH